MQPKCAVHLDCPDLFCADCPLNQTPTDLELSIRRYSEERRHYDPEEVLPGKVLDAYNEYADNE